MRRRVLTAVLLLFVCFFIAATLAAGILLYRNGMQNTTQLLKNQAEYALALYPQDKNFNLINAWADEHHMRITLLTPQGAVLFDSQAEELQNHADRPEFIGALQKGSDTAIRYSQTLKIRLLYYAQYDVETQLVIRAAESVEGIYQSIANLLLTLVLLFLGLLLAALALAYLYLRRVTAPLQEVARSMGDISQGNLDKRVYALYKEEELRKLAGAFNKMADDLTEAFALAKRESGRLRAVLAGMSAGVLALDDGYHILFSNQSARAMLGIGENGYLWEQLRSAELRELADTATQTGLLAEREIRFTALGRERICLVRVAPLIQPEAGTVAVITDLTDQKRLENMKSEFTSNVTHELKTPLTSISGFTETLLSGAVEDPVQAKRFLGIIQNEIGRLTRLIDDILSLSALETQKGEPGTTELMGLLKETGELIRVQAAARGITLEIIKEEPFLYIKGGKDRVAQLFLNLLDNACKYNREHGRIEVRVKKEGMAACVSVADTGIGIPPEHYERIFERFYRVDKSRSRTLGGTGLGLSIVKHIVQYLGGEIQLESEVGKGSTFTVRLPLA